MKRLYWLAGVGLIGLGLLLLAGCRPLSAPPPLPTDTPLPPTETPTPTIVWFPPTPTVTPLPTATQPITPTVDARPAYGALILEDNFSDETTWSTGRMGSGNIAFGPNELTLAVNRPDGYLYSLLQSGSLANYYLEITASPTICRGSDEYGLLLRVSPNLDFYRFSLTCDGQTRLDRFFQGKPSSPQALTPSGAAPRGAPSSSRLAVQAEGKTLHFYINGAYQFTIRDASLPSGGVGVFVRAGGSDAVTVNFSDLKIYQLNSP